MSTAPGGIFVVNDRGGLTRDVYADTFTDLNHGRLGAWIRPNTRRVNWVAAELLTSLGARHGFHGNGRPSQAKLEHVVAWARAYELRHLYIQNAFLPHLPVITDLLATTLSVGWDVWLVGDSGYRTNVQDTVNDFCRNNKVEPATEVEAEQFLTTFGPFSHAPESEPATDTTPMTPGWPKHLPSDDFTTFRAACRDLLTPAAFAVVDEFFVRSFHEATVMVADLPTAPLSREKAVAAFLHRKWREVDDVTQYVVVLRATQVALFHAQLHMRVMLSRLLGTAETMPHEALRGAEPWEQLHAYADPARGAACALAASAATPGDMLALRVKNVAKDGSTAATASGPLTMFDSAKVFVAAQRHLRVAEEGEDALFFADALGPFTEARLRKFLRAARRELGLVFTEPLKLWDRSTGSRWETRWGLSIREVR